MCSRLNLNIYVNSLKGKALVDLVQTESESSPVPNERALCRDPIVESKRAYVKPARVENLLQLYFKDGKVFSCIPFVIFFGAFFAVNFLLFYFNPSCFFDSIFRALFIVFFSRFFPRCFSLLFLFLDFVLCFPFVFFSRPFQTCQRIRSHKCCFRFRSTLIYSQHFVLAGLTSFLMWKISFSSLILTIQYLMKLYDCICCAQPNQAVNSHLTNSNFISLFSKVQCEMPSLHEIKQRVKESLGSIRVDHLRPLNPTPYKVNLMLRATFSTISMSVVPNTRR